MATATAPAGESITAVEPVRRPPKVPWWRGKILPTYTALVIVYLITPILVFGGLTSVSAARSAAEAASHASYYAPLATELDTPSQARVSLLATLALLLVHHGDLHDAREVLQEAQRIQQLVGGPPRWDEVAVERASGELAIRTQDYAGAAELAAAALQRDARELEPARLVPHEPAEPRREQQRDRRRVALERAQQRRGLHVGREHTARGADEGFYAQLRRPAPHRVGIEPRQAFAQVRAVRAEALEERRVRFRMREVQAAAPRQQELAPDRGHRVVQIDGDAFLGQRLGRHEAGRAAADDGGAWRRGIHRKGPVGCGYDAA